LKAPGNKPLKKVPDQYVIDYLKTVVADEAATREDRLEAAKVLLPFIAVKKNTAARALGKKELQKDEAKTAQKGTKWEGLVQ
jgi:hypothetical protein